MGPQRRPAEGRSRPGPAADIKETKEDLQNSLDII